MKISSQRTKRGVIIQALEELVRRNKIQQIKKFQGRVQLDMDLNALRGRS